MKLNDKVSVIIPIFNNDAFLKESLDSVLTQTYSNLEIIAVDDGSNDSSLNILQNYSDRISIISQKNKGLASALNAGIKKMTGKWFKWFSPDDVMYPNTIQVLVHEASKLSENTIFYSNWEIINEKNQVLREFSETDYNELSNFDFNVRLLEGQLINVNTSLIPYSLIKSGCQIRNLEDPVAIDYDFFLQAGLFYKTKFHLITKPLIRFRIHPAQLSHKDIVKSLSYLSKIKEQHLLKLSDNEREKYNSAMKIYDKTKSTTKKIMQLGLKFSTNVLPDRISNKLLLFYLNKIRTSR